MGGAMSRRKGSRVERLLRDVLRAQGYEADRVPLSGASQGFKGDVRFTKGGETKIAEVKARKDAFKSVYEFFDSHVKTQSPYGTLQESYRFVTAGTLVTIGDNMSDVLTAAGLYTPVHETRVTKKILGMQKWLGGADVLVIKDNGKPFLFLTFRGVGK